VRQVFTARDPTEAHFVRGLLESHGVAAIVRGEALWSTRGEAPFEETYPTVWIEDDDREADAREIVRRHETRNAASGPEGVVWRCTKCGEVLEPQFTTCWSCGTDRRF
jgi:hypothetical protein